MAEKNILKGNDAMPGRIFSSRYFFLLVLIVIVLDQLTKWWILSNFALYETREIIPGFFSLTYLTNTGAAFSLLADLPPEQRQIFFSVINVAALGILFLAFKHYQRESACYGISFACIAGGALGNFIDRMRFSHVTDFLDVYIGTYHWPVFNIADSAITIGVSLFIGTSFFMERQRTEKVSACKG